MSCAPPEGGLPLTTEIGTQAVIEGTVSRAGQAVRGAYVRLLDATGEFTAEVPTNAGGTFRFFARPGEWTLRTLVPRGTAVDSQVTAAEGQITTVTVAI